MHSFNKEPADSCSVKSQNLVHRKTSSQKTAFDLSIKYMSSICLYKNKYLIETSEKITMSFPRENLKPKTSTNQREGERERAECNKV